MFHKVSSIPEYCFILTLSKVLITSHGELPDGQFYDPRSKQNFSYDHLRKVSPHNDSECKKLNLENPFEQVF